MPQEAAQGREGRQPGRLATVVVAGTSSGVGKTSLACGLMRALRDRGLVVQAFKAGPDFLDPMHHEAATGRPSVNLDTWMLSRQQVVAAFRRHAAGADVAVVEGVMGLFDGRDGATDAGSTAQLAKWLGAPVVLVLDASAVARSAAAVAKGYIEFDPQLRLAGLLFNKVGGDAHTQWLRDAMAAAGIGAAVLGGVPKSDAVVVPERHLGLHMPGDADVPADLAAALGELVAGHVDLDALLALAATAEVPAAADDDGQQQPGDAAGGDAAGGGAAGGQQPGEGGEAVATPGGPPVRIAVARDAAFCFYYQDNLALLAGAGAELVPWSPLAEPLPADVAGVYLGGGYPERFAAELAENRAAREGLLAFARGGGVVYAECGGLMYLSRSIQLHPEEAALPMVGFFPFRTVMHGKLSMGYVEVAVGEGCPLFPAGARVRGQVHHHSEIVQESVVAGLGPSPGDAGQQAWSTCYTLTPQIPGAAQVAEGFHQGGVLASYVHLHFGACPEFAAALVERCRSVDVAAVGAKVGEAVRAAGYLDSHIASVHTTPPRAKGGRHVAHSRSSPDFHRDGALAAKHHRAELSGAAGGSAAARHHSAEEALPSSRHHSGALDAHYLQRHGLAAQGMPPRSLSPATTLSKVVSMGSLNSYSPHIAAGLPPGDTMSPPLSDSPQQLSPRELEQPGLPSAPGYFGAAPPLPQQQQQQQQQQRVQQPPYLQQQQQQQQPHYAQPPLASYPQQQYAQPPYPHHHPQQAYGPDGWAPPSQTPPPALPPYGSHRSGSRMPSVQSWPHLHQPAWQYGRGSGPGPAAFGPAAQLQQQQQQLPPHPHYGAVGPSSSSFYAANGAAVAGGGGGGAPPSGGSRHSRSGSYDRPPLCYLDGRPASAGAATMLMARSPSPLDLQGLERFPSATPYNWQHSHHPSDKVVSLSPGATEMLWALGLGARVAAVSEACDYPPDAVARAKARRSFAAASAASFSSLGLDRHPGSASTSAAASRRESPVAVGARSAAGAAWQAAAAAEAGGEVGVVVDEEVLARERPGLVVYEEDAAAVGAADSGGPRAMLASGGGMGQAVLEALVAVGLQQSCRVVCIRRRTLSDVLESMLVVGEAAGVRDEALRAVDRLRARLRRAAGQAAAAAEAAPSPARPRVLVLQSLRPLRTVGWWLPDQVTLAGGLCEEAAGDAPVDLTWEQVQAFAPDVLVVAGMQAGSALRPLTDLCSIASLPGWWLLPAVRASAVYVADAALFRRAGPRLVEGVECLARMLWGESGEGAVPDCACPERAVLKLSLRPGQRCRPRLLPNHFVPLAS